MTDDEALSILSECESLGNYVAVADDNGVEKPYFRKGSIVLRGDFFPHELEAILHFAPKGSLDGIAAQWVSAMTDPRQTVLLESGRGLDAIGARPEIDRPRNGIETDHDYRNRLIERMREIDAPSVTG